MQDLHHTYESLHKEHHIWRKDLLLTKGDLLQLLEKVQKHLDSSKRAEDSVICGELKSRLNLLLTEIENKLTNLTETKLRMISLRSRAPYNTLYLGEDRSRYCPAMGPKLNPATVFSFAPDSAQAVEVEFNLSAPSAQDCPGGFYETQITASVNGIVIAEAIIHHEWWED